jgi:predicted Zn-dependent protease
MNIKIYPLLFILLTIFFKGYSQNTEEVFFHAMDDEMNRSTTGLKLDKYNPPFFLAYMLSDSRSFYASATLGALTTVSQNPGRSASYRLMVGDYSLNDENFVGARSSTGGVSLPMPLENDYAAIRRALWSITDRSYKSTVETYEQKLTALKQQNEQDTSRLNDYCKIEPVKMMVPKTDFTYNRSQYEDLIKELSAEFKAYPDFNTSNVTLMFIQTDYYYLSNEGSKIRMPNNIAILSVNAGTQADDGEMLGNQLNYTALDPSGLPAKDKIKQDIRQMADFLVSMRKAPIVKDSYSGPVIFEGEAAAELASQVLFSNNGLISNREQVYASDRRGGGTEQNLDNRVGQKVCSENITIKALPKLKTYSGIPLAGSFEIDAEGVVPPSELVLVENGMLKTLLNDRVPTVAAKQSNGHRRAIIGGTSSTKGPGVIEISYDKGKTSKNIYKEVAKEASKNGLTYFYVVRKLGMPNIGMNSQLAASIGRGLPVTKPVAIYRVSAKTGQEELVRSAVFSEFTMNNLKRISGATKEMQVYNYVDINIGLPCTYILPQIIAINEVNLVNHKNQNKPKLPVVPNPLTIR